MIAGLLTNFDAIDVYGVLFATFSVVCLLVCLWNLYRIVRGR